MSRKAIKTDTAPSAIGTYSQAIKVDTLVFLSGQIPLHPESMDLVDGDVAQQIRQVFNNLQAVAVSAGGDLSDIVKLNVYLTDLSDFPVVNSVMSEYFEQPYPARAAVGVAALPKGANVEIDAIMVMARDIDQDYNY